MFHFIVHASLTEFIFWIFILLLILSSAYVALKDKIRSLFTKDKQNNQDNTSLSNQSLEQTNLHKVDKEIKELEKEIRRRK